MMRWFPKYLKHIFEAFLHWTSTSTVQYLVRGDTVPITVKSDAARFIPFESSFVRKQMACPGIFSNMKTAQSITFFIRQLRPTARGHSILPHAPGRIFVQPRNPLRSPTSTLNNLSKPYSTRTQAHDGLLTQKTPPGASFAPNQCTTDSTSSSLPGKPPIIENPDTKAFSASIQTQRPSYQIHFTCKPCGFRSAHEISKHGYHSGSILVTCPSCKNRHVISDHLKVSASCPLSSYFIHFWSQYRGSVLCGNGLKRK